MSRPKKRKKCRYHLDVEDHFWVPSLGKWVHFSQLREFSAFLRTTVKHSKTAKSAFKEAERWHAKNFGVFVTRISWNRGRRRFTDWEWKGKK